MASLTARRSSLVNASLSGVHGRFEGGGVQSGPGERAQLPQPLFDGPHPRSTPARREECERLAGVVKVVGDAIFGREGANRAQTAPEA
jgi:hypothetical protein